MVDAKKSKMSFLWTSTCKSSAFFYSPFTIGVFSLRLLLFISILFKTLHLGYFKMFSEWLICCLSRLLVLLWWLSFLVTNIISGNIPEGCILLIHLEHFKSIFSLYIHFAASWLFCWQSISVFSTQGLLPLF
jgi:hypothetical protein